MRNTTLLYPIGLLESPHCEFVHLLDSLGLDLVLRQGIHLVLSGMLYESLCLHRVG